MLDTLLTSIIEQSPMIAVVIIGMIALWKSLEKSHNKNIEILTRELEYEKQRTTDINARCEERAARISKQVDEYKDEITKERKMFIKAVNIFNEAVTEFSVLNEKVDHLSKDIKEIKEVINKEES